MKREGALVYLLHVMIAPKTRSDFYVKMGMNENYLDVVLRKDVGAQYAVVRVELPFKPELRPRSYPLHGWLGLLHRVDAPAP